jgi:ATP-dependent exoDNAse (exonuclease V) beta subunit
MTTPAFTPHDQPARARIREALDETLFVEAGAGTGKTTSLVERIVRLVATGTAALDRVAAITFTEAAAAELRDRVREALERAAEDPSLPEAERANCLRGVRDLDQAAIETLHSFAGRLLRERPLEAGLPPAFEVMDEIAADLAFEDAWAAWQDAALDDPALTGPLRLALALGLRLSHLHDVARAFHAEHDWLAEADFARVPLPAPQAADAIVAAVEEMERLCRYAKKGDADELAAHTQTVLGLARRLSTLEERNPGMPLEAWRLLAQAPKISTGRGRMADWKTDPVHRDNACRLLKALLTDLQETVQQEMAQVRQTALPPLLEAGRAFVLDYAAERKRQGRAEFHDLLVWARDLLRDDLSARDHFRARFSHVLIDEMQDTDPIQAEIAFFLVEDAPPDTPPQARPRRWTEVRPTPGKLFVVGDPKQSIYRFRRADAALMARVQALVAGEAAPLVQNFRSQQPVIEWVNHVFALWMGEAADQGQVAYTPLVHRWTRETDHPTSPAVRFLGGPVDERTVDAVRMREAADIAVLVRQVRQDRWQVLDVEATQSSGLPQYRDARYADICILMPQRTALRGLEIALEEAGVPFRLEGSSLIFGTQEVRDLLNCLRAIDDPTDQVALVAALRSPAFACSDVDLLRFVEAGGRLEYLTPLREAARQGPVAEAFEALVRYHERRQWASPATLIEEFMRERRLMEAALAHPRPREQWRRYKFLVERARAFTEAGGTSLRAFLDWAERQVEEGVRVTDVPVPEEDDDAVRVMTIHAAKGLEFPVTVTTGLNAAGGNRADPVLFDRDARAVEARLGPAERAFETPGYSDLADRERSLEAQEAVRLMYVAATRARDHLVLCVHRTIKDTQSAAARIAGFLDGYDHLWSPVPISTPARVPPPAPPPPLSVADQEALDADTPESREAWLAERARVLAEMSRPAAVAATTLARVDKESQDLPDEPWRRGRGGAPLGRAVHAVLQTVDLATGAGVGDVARAQATAEGIPQRAQEIADLCRGALGAAVVRRAVASGRWWREVPVGAPIGDTVLEGFIDLLFEEEDGLVIVDYKTDALEKDEEMDAAMARYRLQGAAYALALQQASGKPVKEVLFLFLRPLEVRPIPDLEAAMRDVESAIGRYLGASQPS